MSFKALVYAYVIGGFTFIPLVLLAVVFITFWTSVPVEGDDTPQTPGQEAEEKETRTEPTNAPWPPPDVNDLPRTRKGWLIMRRTFEESAEDASYVNLVRSFLDSRSKDPKRSRPKDMWYVVLKGKILFLYEDETMTECGVALELGGQDVTIHPEALLEGELFTRRNAICLRPKSSLAEKASPSVTRQTKLKDDNAEEPVNNSRRRPQERDRLAEMRVGQRPQTFNASWYIFIRSVCEMEDWYLALVHASEYPLGTPLLSPLRPIFDPTDMEYLVSTLDAQPDIIPMRWFNALLGRLFFSYYRTQTLETFMIGRFMRKLSKVKRPAFLTDIVVTEVSVGNKPPMFSKPMLKELTKEGDASMEVHFKYKGEFRITVEATATINLGARFKSYAVKLALAVVLKELEGNLLIKVKRPPSDRIWYAFTQTPKMVLEVEPIVSDRQITWGMILGTIESRIKEIIQESVVLPHMDDISFFDTDPTGRRGGIWSHTVRRKRAPSLAETVPDAGLEAYDGDREPLSPSSTDVAPPLSPRPHSLEEPMVDIGTPVPSVARPATVSGEAFSDLADEHADPWFLDAESTEDLGEPSSVVAEPTVWEGPYPEGGESTVENPMTSNAFLSPHIARRSSSQTSLSARFNGGHSGPNLDRRESAPFFQAAQIPPPSPSHQTSRSASSTASNASSFLATLKARAGDKEALSKTAKETMRKWGVNWGTLRRDSQEQAEDSPDHGAAYSRAQSEIGSLAQKARASYAEVRAVVAEWRDRESPRPDTPPTPQLSTNNGKGVPRPVSSQAADGITPQTLFSQETSTSDHEHAQRADPSLSRSSTLSQSSRRSEGSREFPKSSPDLETPSPAIYTQQPSQAKAMTIPGIHASHRGEVMSMGYVAPSPPAESRSSPAIQSVYRLWKNSLPSQSQPLISQAVVPSSGDVDGHGIQERESTERDPGGSTAHGNPPPLPRRSSIAVVPPQPARPHVSVEEGQGPLVSEVERKSVDLDESGDGMIAESVAPLSGPDPERSAISSPLTPDPRTSVSS